MSDRKKMKQSKEDIAKQFELPERQSKITTLLNQAGQAYCICRSSDSSRFMIACDFCEEWYHGDCVKISEREARYIKTYFCDKCREEDPTLKTRFKLQKRDLEPTEPTSDEPKKRKKEHNENRPAKKSQSSRRRSKDEFGCGECSGCLTSSNCGTCNACYNMQKRDHSSRNKIKCERRICKKLIGKSSGGSSRKRATNTTQESMEVSLQHLQTTEARQCYGPQCTQPARYGSKYCSTKCGMLLGTARIYQVLPQRIQEWSLSPCFAESLDRKALERVRSELSRVQATLRMYDKQHAELDALVNRVKNCNQLPKVTDDKEHEDESLIHCITCGHEVHSRTAIKHMEKCFVKHEAQASFGSRHRTKIEGTSMFCDYYNPINATYCKRLRVLCPEHSKDPKINDTDLCGCPLVRDIFVPNGDFCKAAKKSCLKHYMWEKLRRAEIDMERVRQWMRVDELIEQERQIRLAMASRAGVLGLMLHSTYNHEVMERITGQPTKPDTAKEKK